MQAPTAAELLQNPTVQRALDEAWADSLPADPPWRHEEGGWIHMDTAPPSKGSQSMTETAATRDRRTPLLTATEALAIAQADATQTYRDISVYRICLALEDDGWHIDYELKNPTLKGGGPHYVIDADTGTITSRRYEQ